MAGSFMSTPGRPARRELTKEGSEKSGACASSATASSVVPVAVAVASAPSVATSPETEPQNSAEVPKPQFRKKVKQ